MNGTIRYLRWVSLWVLLYGVALGLTLQAKILSPKEFLGFEVGEDRKLADWSQIVEYYNRLSQSSDRIQVTELGKTTEGRPFILATLSAPENLRQLEHYRTIQKRLADPRNLPPAEAAALIKEGKTVLLLTCNIHSSEVASAQTSLEFAYRMATDDSERTREILRNVILLHVPSLNPDGQDMIVQWYRRYVGTPHEGAPMPYLYHKYVGHDNNRDWYMFTQVETRLAVEKIHNAWHPQIVYDVHQMGAAAARIFMPPWVDPIDPNIDPILVQEMNAVGSTMAMDLTAEGKKGVVTNAMYDLWSPSRHYQCYHGGLRILTESASARLASPIKIPFDRLEVGRGYNAKVRSWNFPDPWPGGEWRLRDIVDYQLSAFAAILTLSARYRDQLVRNFHTVLRRAVTRKEPPYAFVIPTGQKDPSATAQMLNTLRFGLVEVQRAKAAFQAGGDTYPPGSYVITLAQPFGPFAKTLLETQKYPDRRQYPGGPPERPYDTTAHTLPLLMGVRVIAVGRPFMASLEPVDKIEPPPGEVVGRGTAGYLLGPETNAALVAVQRLLRQGFSVYRLAQATRYHDQMFPAGAIYLAPRPDLETAVSALARELSLKIYALESRPQGAAYELHPVRLGIYKSYVPSMDEGWTRYILDQMGIPYQSIYNKDVRAGRLHERFDAILIPDSAPGVIVNGYSGARRRVGDDYGTVPSEFADGIGEEGVRQLKVFMEAGGSLITLNNAGNLLTERFNLPVRNVLSGQTERSFYCPGSILRVEVDSTHPIAYGMDKEAIAWFEHSPAFETTGGTVIARYPHANPLLSGWLLGEKYLQGRSAIVEAPVGRGRAILLGYRVQYRAQSYSTYKLLLNAFYYAAAKKVTF